MKAPRGLSAAEAALWRKVTETVKPLAADEQNVPPEREVVSPSQRGGVGGGGSAPAQRRAPPPNPPPSGGGLSRAAAPAGLDSSWERKLARAHIDPDFTLDLHGHTLDQAHRRLDSGLMQAKAMGARLVLLVTGHPRPADAADRGSKRGAIRAKVLDWLAAGPHAADIAAIRPAHRRHGGTGALYLVLRRPR